MTCYHPVPAYQDGRGGRVRLWPPLGTATMHLACGSCLGCRTARALDWARRCVHEANEWSENIFVTLTYDDAHLPKGGFLEPHELQLFLKRLRKSTTRRVRFFAAGEYGESSGRPHYHLLLFNFTFADLVLASRTRYGPLYTSETLSRLWTYGSHKIGTVTGASANYIAQYTLKQSGGSPCDEDGVARPKPFVRMSRRPGIGDAWLKRYREDLGQGYLVYDGKPGRIPRGYLNKLSKVDDPLRDQIRVKMLRYDRKMEPERLAAGEVIHSRLRSLTGKGVL